VIKLILAKSKRDKNDEIITLSKHTKNVIEQIDVIIEKNNIFGLKKIILQLSAGLHDIGKVLPNFQKTMHKKLVLSYENEFDNKEIYDFKIPHNYFSLLFINKKKILELIEQLNNKEFEENLKSADYLKMILNAVAFHHWRETSIGLLLSGMEELDVITKDFANDMEKELKIELQDVAFEITGVKESEKIKLTDFIEFDHKLFEYLKNGGSFIETEMITPPYLLAFLPDRILQAEEITRESTFYLGNLIRADHFASFAEGQSEDVGVVEMKSLTEEEVYQALKVYSEEKGWDPPFRESWQYKELNNKKMKNVILLAPTGSGKTEFAYMFSKGRKMIFSLPLKAAVNSVYMRSCELFGEGNCAILHSDAQLMLYDELTNNGKEKIDESVMGDIQRITSVSRMLGFPVQVCTGDQIFPIVLKYPGYERTFCVLSNSCLIIDEIQAYDPRAIAIIITLIREAVIMGSKVLLMTATLPDFIKDDLKRAFGLNDLKKMFVRKKMKQEEVEKIEEDADISQILINKYEDESFGGIEKHNIIFEKKMIEEDIAKICELMQRGKRIIVIRNKVKNAQDTYIKIKNELNIPEEELESKLFLLHSKFTQSDRKKIEEKVVVKEFRNSKNIEFGGKILISTQIVEASLNIDADYLFTDIAPADALVQRMGRIYRRYRSGKHAPEEPNVIVYCGKKNNKNHTKELYRGVYLEDIIKSTVEAFSKIIKANGPVLNEKIKAEIIKIVYSKENLKKSYYPKYRQTLELLERGYTSDSRREAQKLFRDIFQINIIPIQFKEEVENLLKQEDYNNYLEFRREIISKYVISVSPYQIKWDELKKSEFENFKYEFYYSPRHVYNKNLGLRQIENKREKSSDSMIEDKNDFDSRLL
jgi:CRISPR-associated endonuclease/helicase Cas3